MPLVKGTGWTEQRSAGAGCYPPVYQQLEDEGLMQLGSFPPRGRLPSSRGLSRRAILHFPSSPSFMAASESPLLGLEGEGSAESILFGLVSLSLHVTSTFPHFF